MDSPDTDSPASWDEAQLRLESCRTHSYCEETGCLYSARAGPRRPETEPAQQPGELGSDDPSPGANPLSETQENPTLPPQCCCTRDGHEPPQCVRTVPAQEDKDKDESGLDFDAARKWNSADPPRDCGGSTTDLSSDLCSGIVGVNGSTSNDSVHCSQHG